MASSAENLSLGFLARSLLIRSLTSGEHFLNGGWLKLNTPFMMLDSISFLFFPENGNFPDIIIYNMMPKHQLSILTSKLCIITSGAKYIGYIISPYSPKRNLKKVARFHFRRKSKIYQFNGGVIAWILEHDVLGFEIPVTHIEIVKIDQG